MIPLAVLADRKGTAVRVEAVLDTGFNGFLTLPAHTIRTLGLLLFGEAEAMLGDGTTITLRKFQAAVAWDGACRDVLVLEANGGPLIGMALLYGSRVLLDVVDGGPVTIEALSAP